MNVDESPNALASRWGLRNPQLGICLTAVNNVERQVSLTNKLYIEGVQGKKTSNVYNEFGAIVLYAVDAYGRVH